MSAISAAAAKASRRSAIGVAPAWPGHAVDPDLEPRRAVDRGHDAERQAFGLQHRPLLDMDLDEGGDVVGAKSSAPVRVAAEGLERVAHQDAARILLVERVLRISRRRARASR